MWDGTAVVTSAGDKTYPDVVQEKKKSSFSMLSILMDTHYICPPTVLNLITF